jgi:hypothetical protein
VSLRFFQWAPVPLWTVFNATPLPFSLPHPLRSSGSHELGLATPYCTRERRLRLCGLHIKQLTGNKNTHPHTHTHLLLLTPPLPTPHFPPTDDPDLTYWVKLPAPVMSLPPPGLNISCWRDPFCLTRPAAAGMGWYSLYQGLPCSFYSAMHVLGSDS